MAFMNDSLHAFFLSSILLDVAVNRIRRKLKPRVLSRRQRRQALHLTFDP